MSKIFSYTNIVFLLIYGLSIIITSNADEKLLNDICLGCICEAISGCNLTAPCYGGACGLFRITWPYWYDGGKQTVDSKSPDDKTAYEECVKDPNCAANTMENYMSRYKQDCNKDGVINCYDFAAIHKLGGFGCEGDLSHKYYTDLDDCLKYHSP